MTIGVDTTRCEDYRDEGLDELGRGKLEESSN